MPQAAAAGWGSSTPSIYETCMSDPSIAAASAAAANNVSSNNSTSTDEQQDLLFRCIVTALESARSADKTNQESWFLVLCGALVFSMQVGFAMLCAGCVRKKNLQNTMLKNLLDACGAAVAFYVLGFGLAFGGQETTAGNTFVGNTNFCLTGTNVNPAFWFYEFAFSATAATIVAGTVAERCQMISYMIYSAFLTGVVYPVVAHSVWSHNGFLSVTSSSPLLGSGALDFAGSGVVHITGGVTALVAAMVLGARQGRFTDARGRVLDVPNPMPGHSIALQLMGTMLLWFSWYGFNPGSALLLQNAKSPGSVAALAAVNTSLSAAAGAVASLLANLVYQERQTGELNFDLTTAMNGALGGLVAVTAGCAVVEYWAALLIGLVAGLLYLIGSHTLVRYRIDDAVDAIPVHLFCGTWGTFAVGLLASPGRIVDAYGPNSPVSQHGGLFYGAGATLLACQLVEIFFIAGWAAATMTPFFFFLQYHGWLRVDSLEERIGLDRSYHGEWKKTDTTEDDFLSRLDLQAYRRERQRQRQQKREQKLNANGGGTSRAAAPEDDSVMSWNGLSYEDGSGGGTNAVPPVSRRSSSDAEDEASRL